MILYSMIIDNNFQLNESSENATYDIVQKEVDDQTFDSSELLYNYIKNSHNKRKHGHDIDEESTSRAEVHLNIFDQNVKINEAYEISNTPRFINLKMGW